MAISFLCICKLDAPNNSRSFSLGCDMLALDILHAFLGLLGCDTCTRAFLQGNHTCYPDVAAEVKDKESVAMCSSAASAVPVRLRVHISHAGLVKAHANEHTDSTWTPYTVEGQC